VPGERWHAPVYISVLGGRFHFRKQLRSDSNSTGTEGVRVRGRGGFAPRRRFFRAGLGRPRPQLHRSSHAGKLCFQWPLSGPWNLARSAWSWCRRLLGCWQLAACCCWLRS
jgi:hypothetical protein